MAELSKKRPVFRNINIFRDVIGYRLPLPGIVSILHRISGLLMFVLLPFIIWMFDASVTSEISYAHFTAVFNEGLGGFLLKLVALALLWALLHHFFAGLRHIRLHDLRHGQASLVWPPASRWRSCPNDSDTAHSRSRATHTATCSRGSDATPRSKLRRSCPA